MWSGQKKKTLMATKWACIMKWELRREITGRKKKRARENYTNTWKIMQEATLMQSEAWIFTSSSPPALRKGKIEYDSFFSFSFFPLNDLKSPWLSWSHTRRTYECILIPSCQIFLCITCSCTWVHLAFERETLCKLWSRSYVKCSNRRVEVWTEL